MTQYAKYGVYALPAAFAAAWFGLPAWVGIPLALIGIASGAVLWKAKHPF